MQAKIAFYLKPSAITQSLKMKTIPVIPTFEYELFFDGCSKGNPGPAGAGAVIYKNDIEIWSKSIYVGKKETNNVAEYSGLILGLEEAVRQNITELSVKGDSELVIKQINGLYKVKSPSMIPLYIRVKSLQTCFERIEFIHLYRDKNKRADELSNIGVSQNR